MSALYPLFKEALLTAQINMMTDVIKVQAVSAAYVYSAAHQYLSSVPAGARIGSAVTLASKSISGGAFDAADATIPAPSGDPITALVLYREGANDGASNLIAYLNGYSRFPVSPIGIDLPIVWNDDLYKIFAL